MWKIGKEKVMIVKNINIIINYRICFYCVPGGRV